MFLNFIIFIESVELTCQSLSFCRKSFFEFYLNIFFFNFEYVKGQFFCSFLVIFRKIIIIWGENALVRIIKRFSTKLNQKFSWRQLYWCLFSRIILKINCKIIDDLVFFLAYCSFTHLIIYIQCLTYKNGLKYVY